MAIKSSNKVAMSFNVLIKEEEGLYIAHCLELDIVAARETMEEAKKEIFDLIRVQVDYAFAHKNLENLFHPAPAEVWKEFYECKKQEEKLFSLKPSFKSEEDIFIPPNFLARTCWSATH